MLQLLIPLFLRITVSLHPYSGQENPPMYGDYEAQRHWMEITYNLPIKEWYFNSTNNDLMYWGLDYPPITAYHSLICGAISAIINPQYVELYFSRGFESYYHKLFMRYSVFLVDLIIFIPAFFIYFNILEKNMKIIIKKDKVLEDSTKNIKFSVILMFALIYPGLILIDFGHFQYNCVSLGLFILSVSAVLKNNLLIASFLFCCALSYKQMELYHSMPFFFFFLGLCVKCMNSSNYTAGVLKLVQIALTVLFSFVILWFPFIFDVQQLSQVIHRIFPLARGIFEDKVSNIWCTINIFYKLRLFFDNNEMATICIIATLLSLLPSSIDLLFRPTFNKFLYALINSSLSFFLFSFQVHEKSILLVAIPVIMIQPFDPFPSFWFLIISTFSLLSLIIKDELVLAFVALTLGYLIALSLFYDIDAMIVNLVGNPKHSSIFRISNLLNFFVHLPHFKVILKFSFYSSVFGCIILTMCSIILNPPKQYPDLFSLLLSVYSCLHFLCFWVYFNWKQIRLPYIV